MKTSRWHVGFMAFSTYFRMGSQLLIFVLLARILGAERFGVISYWLSVAILSAIPINYGFGIQILREASHAQESFPLLLSEMVRAKVWLSALVAALLLGVSLLHPLPAVFWLLLMVAVADSFSEFYNFALRSRGRFAFEARITFATSLLQFCVPLVAFCFHDVLLVAAAYATCRVVSLLVTYGCARAELALENSAPAVGGGGYLPVLQTLKRGFAYAADMAISTLNSSLDIILLQQLSGARSVGIYQAGSRLMLGGATPASVLSNVYLPRVSALETGGKEYSSAIRGTNLKLVLVGGSISLMLALFNVQIVALLFGPGYRDLAPLLPWFALVLVLRYVAAAFGINLTASGHQSVRAVANIGYLVTFLGAALLLVPEHGAVGLLAATSCSSLALALIYSAYVVQKKLPSGFDLRNAGVSAAIIAVICSRIAGGSP